MHRSQLSLYWLEQIRRKTAHFVHFLQVIPSEARNLAQDYGSHSSHSVSQLHRRSPSLLLRMTLASDIIHPAPLTARRPHVQPIFQIKQSPQRVRQKTPAPIGNFLLRNCGVLGHPRCHFRVVCPCCDEFPQCLRVESTGSKELAVHRTVVVVRTVPADEFCTAFIHQARSHGRKVG